MQTIFKLTILCTVTMLAACQTSGTSSAAVDPKEADLVRYLMDETCAVTTTKSSNIRQKKADLDRIAVLSIHDRHDGWRAADIAFKGFRDNIYFNKGTAQMICGGKNWSSFKGGNYTASNSKILSELSD